jgi:dynein heavy chain
LNNTNNTNNNYVNPPLVNLEDLYNSYGNNYTPILFILSPGVDPYSQIEKLASVSNAKLVQISMGQGQSKRAKEKVSFLYLKNYEKNRYLMP